jgi:bis(5'-nucleosidyl)-tetraphosphatase
MVEEPAQLPELRACGVAVMRREPEVSFLLVRKPGRWDVPKGHMDPGETDLECALRELAEETGILAADIELDAEFRFEIRYLVRSRRTNNQDATKIVVLFLGWLKRDVEIRLTEHTRYEWFAWNPPHRIQSQTIDPLLKHIGKHLSRRRS